MRDLFDGVDPADVLVFEDTEASVSSARAAGVGRVLAVTGTLDPERLRGADELIEHVDVDLMRREHRVMLVIAHRRASAELPENTLPAFERAIELGADFVEIDVHADSGGRLVVTRQTPAGP